MTIKIKSQTYPKIVRAKIKKLENRLEDIIFKTAEARILDFVHYFVPHYGTDKGDYCEASLFLTDKDIASSQH